MWEGFVVKIVEMAKKKTFSPAFLSRYVDITKSVRRWPWGQSKTHQRGSQKQCVGVITAEGITLSKAIYSNKNTIRTPPFKPCKRQSTLETLKHNPKLQPWLRPTVQYYPPIKSWYSIYCAASHVTDQPHDLLVIHRGINVSDQGLKARWSIHTIQKKNSGVRVTGWARLKTCIQCACHLTCQGDRIGPQRAYYREEISQAAWRWSSAQPAGSWNDAFLSVLA